MLSSSSSSVKSNRDFRYAHDLASYRLRTIDISQRRAFDVRLPSLEEYETVAAANKHRKLHRLSPSKEHLQILHELQNTRYITQIQFSPSTDYNCDHPIAAVAAAAATNADTASSSSRDGRYRCIDPIQQFRTMISGNSKDVKSSLTTTMIPPPQLSHRKMRLPNRADVGFPNASESDVLEKQTEIRHETAWEETSPRIISIVTSEHLGEPVVGTTTMMMMNTNRYTRNNSSSHGAKNWNAKQHERHIERMATTFPGIPWAGAPLLRARWDNLRHFLSYSFFDGSLPPPSELPPALYPDPFSMLAPPLDATYSKSQGWKPRMLWDRPAGMRYALAAVLEVDLPPTTTTTPNNESISSSSLPSQQQQQQKQQTSSETFSCSLSLYTLPPYCYPSNVATTTNSSLATASTSAVSMAAHQHVHHLPGFGKISEEIWFPASSVQGGVDDNESWPFLKIPGPDGMPIQQWGIEDEDDNTRKTIQAWWEHTKAIFAYDPYELSMENNSYKSAFHYSSQSSSSSSSLSQNKLPSSLYLVLQVYRNVSGGKGKEVNQPAILSPVCFGITKFFSSKINMRFPEGHVKDMQLYACPEIPESQDAFVDRLWGVVHHHSPKTDDATSVTSAVSVRSNNYQVVDDGATVDSIATSRATSRMENDDAATKRRGLAGRLFRSASPKPRPKTKSTLQRNSSVSSANSNTSTNTFHPVISEPIPNARAKFFLSDLRTDFLQVMLTTPSVLAAANTASTFKSQQTAPGNKGPKLLVDLTGDGAILLFGNDNNNQTRDQPSPDQNWDTKFSREDDGIMEIAAKRSNLVRLPPAARPAGYTAGEFREVLYLRARPERHYDVDSQFGSSCCTAINLLYIYPRLLQLRQLSRNNDVSNVILSPTTSITIRIRIMHSDFREITDNAPEKSRGTPIACFYSTSPWKHLDLLESVYTKVTFPSPRSGDIKNTYNVDWERGTSMRDEMKVRLPDVLDGSYNAEFTLLVTDVSSSNPTKELSWSPVAEATIPLSNSSSREPKAGLRVATAIPNGKHRLELGSFQLHLETRLISSFHVGDPSVGLAIREYNATTDPLDKPHHLANRSVSSSVEINEAVKFSSSVLASASESTIAGHFRVLLYIHLRNIIDRGSDESESTVVSAMDAIHSLINALQKIQSSHSTHGDEDNANRLRSFFKKNLDIFDESLFSSSSETSFLQQKGEDQVSDSFHEVEILAKEEGKLESSEKELRDDISVRRRRKFVRGSRRDSRDTRIIHFSRVAYGASKTDRMKAEAELRYDSNPFASFFDDDETIATAPSLYSGTRKFEATATFTFDDARSITRQEQQIAQEFSATNSIARSGGSGTSNPLGKRSLGGNDFAQRVRTAAQIILAPCVGPSLSTKETTSRHVPLTATNACANMNRDNNENHLVARVSSFYQSTAV
jgi:hypothetical protein